MNARPTRERLRALHLVVAGTLAMLIYNPLFDTARGRFAIRFVVVPLLVLTGAAMWSLRALRDRSRSP
jgi:thiosulfate reductase cytochrome b subunit